ncbi:MAG: transposase family protein [Nitrospira sp. CG24B]|nr:MAG: transposase family protein [Nitrospira sp. CG24B]
MLLHGLRWFVRWCSGLWHWLRRWRQPRPRTAWSSPRTGGPTRRPHALPKPRWVRDEIVRLKALMPHAGCRTIMHTFNRRFAVRRQMTVGKTYVADTIRRQQYAILCLRRTLKHRVPRRMPRNLIWGMDLLTKTDATGHQHMVLAILDHASRACLCVQRLRNKSSLTIWHHVITVCRQYGCPRFLRTDNEAVFTSRALRFALHLLGIRLQHSDPGCPWQNGRVERLIGTLKWLLMPHAIDDASSLDRALVHTRAVYNHLRPHQHLYGRTPAEVWAGVDVILSTRTSRRWLRRWERQWEQSVGESHSPG